MHLPFPHPRRSRRNSLVAFLVTAIFASTPLGRAESAAPQPAQAATAHLTIANPTHDFGRVMPGEPLRYRFEVSNTGNAPLAITAVTPSCGCTTAGEWPHRLEPGHSGVIPVEVDTTGFTGEVSKTITIASNDPAQPEITVELKALLWSPVTLSKSVVVLPAVADPNQSATGSVDIDNQLETPLHLSDPHSDQPAFAAVLSETIPGRKFVLKITTVPPLAEGTQVGRISLRTSNDKLPEISVRAVATVLPAVQIAPERISFRTAKLTAAEKRFAVVLSHRASNLQVSDVATNAPGVQLSVVSTADGTQCTIMLTFPAGFEFHDGQKLSLRGKTNQPSAPTFEVPIICTDDD